MKTFDIIKVNRRLLSSFHEYDIGWGATFNLDELRQNTIMVKFLCEEHTHDPDCIVGHIGELYRIREDIRSREAFGEMTYREHLEDQIQKGLLSPQKENE